MLHIDAPVCHIYLKPTRNGYDVDGSVSGDDPLFLNTLPLTVFTYNIHIFSHKTHKFQGK